MFKDYRGYDASCTYFFCYIFNNVILKYAKWSTVDYEDNNMRAKGMSGYRCLLNENAIVLMIFANGVTLQC